MRVGVTGSTGLIGRALVSSLGTAGHTAVPFIRSTQSTPGSIRWSPSTGTIELADVDRVGGIDAIVHLAGAGIADRRWTASRRHEILKSRVDGTATLATWCTQSADAPRIFVSGSAIGFYGDRGEEVVTEESGPGRGFLADVCREWEAAAHVVPHDRVRVTTLRTGIVMSAAGGALKKQLPLFRLGVGGRLGNGQQWMSPISLRDTVSAIIHVLVNDIVGPVNLVAPEPARNSEVTQAIARAVQRPALLPVPKFALAAVLGKECADEMLMVSQRIVPQQLLRHGFHFADPTVSDIMAWATHSTAE